MTKLSLENLQAVFSDHLVQFGDDPGTSRIGCCKMQDRHMTLELAKQLRQVSLHQLQNVLI